ncbi:hypothetical protein DFP72DRAFT_891521 [Ephemerocybe angulata]|uniref:Septation initiation network scaffold protein cdc11 n=1 Tax=Ephemerocybe angulata TaxID=980116 RepID=A0A8H6M964_9AGAR|nr:hypothetical protein DFP72DRAFT_891521 [Tulosesus angulatus]
MSGSAHNQPAWQTEELQEEWVDLEPEDSVDDDDQSYGTRSISLTAPLSTHIHTNSELEGDAVQNTIQAGGTFLVREEIAHAPLVPKTPGRHAKPKDFFTPLPLERMFDPPTPPTYSGSLRSRDAPSPPQSAVVLDEAEDTGPSDKILETDMPNMDSFQGRRPSLACQFTFSMAKNHASRLNPQAHSTPNPPHLYPSAPPTDSRLRLFQFQYDTYTREHLSAMVDSIAINTPSGSGTTTSPPSYGQHLSRVSEITGTAANNNHLRSAKRIKLSPPSEFYGEGAGAGVVIQRPHGKDYVGESRSLMEKIKQARDFSTISTVAETPSQEPKESPSGGSIVLNRPSSESNSSRRPSYLSVPDSRQDNATSTSNTMTSKSSYSSFNYRQNAMALMDQIKSDMKGQKRIFSSDTETSTITTQIEDQSDSYDRSALSSAVHRRKASRQEKENHGPNTPGHRRTSSSKSNSFRTKPSPKKHRSRASIPTDELGQALANNLSRLSVSDRDANTSTAAPPSTDRPVEHRPPSSLAPALHPSSSIRGRPNEDLNRFVSSSTASGSTASGTTLTSGGAPSFVKHAGPPHLRTIAPADLPSLPERMGDMLFDRVMMRWVKNTAMATRDPDKSGGSVEELSDDPFGDIESLPDDSRGGDTRPNAGELEPAEDQEGLRAAVAEMSAIEERSEAEDDDEELELTSFSTDASAHVVDIMTGVDTSGYNDGDETTDSEDDVALDDTVTITRTATVPVVDYESGDEDFSPTSVAHGPLATTSAYLLNADMGLAPHVAHLGMGTPSKRNGRAMAVTPTTVRSVLKSSGTPNSAMKSRSRYETPQSQRHRRSVSFSDGKLDGPMVDLNSSTDTEGSSGRGGRTYDKSAITQPSARTKRIADMMDALVNSDFEEDESPSKTSSSAGRMEELRPLTERDLASSMASGAADSQPELRPRRVFSRSQTHRASGGSNGKSVNRVNGTFLTECSFAVAHDRLVEVITDVQPFEPHWEQLNAIDLSGKKLESVARLKEFLPRLDSLNLNANQLSWLSGVPGSIRTLSVARNSLTGLTSYNHLPNLENLDISHNEIESLRQLECLRHLRELKADGNRITKLDGLERMDGLVKLSVQGNSIQSVDLEGFRWTRLEMLNISHNRLDSVRGLSSLEALIAVNLDNNALREVDFGSHGMPRLRILRVSGNRLSELKVSVLPNLRTLYADNNSLSVVAKVDRLTRLENLSLRNQSGRAFNLLTRDVRDVKRLYLSGNPLKAPILKEACYNLVYLELAACRLTTLPEGFGRLCPNVRVLNLNYNFLEDVRGLEELTRIQKLTIIGSRLKSTKPLIRVLQRMPDVEMLDFR